MEEQSKKILIKRISAEVTLDVRHQVLWPSKPVDYVRLAEDDNGLHFGLYLEEVLISVISVFVHNGEAQFRKFATLENYQGLGYGSKLFKHMLSVIESMGVRRIWCNARLDANGFYKRVGFEDMDDSIFYKGEIGYTIMEKIVEKMDEVAVGGIYKHFKGNLYKVLNIGIHSETEEQMVVYMKLYDDYSVWVRPYSMFVDMKSVDGTDVKRFTLISK